MFKVRNILKLGSAIFGLSALLLLFLPSLFLQLLALDSDQQSLIWSMRMIGVTLVALSGNMWFNSENADDETVRKVGLVMAVSATSLGVLTLLIPTPISLFTAAYAMVGFSFGTAYIVALLKNQI
jgi:uncharacterized membrane protein